jgi:hypothetical protein
MKPTDIGDFISKVLEEIYLGIKKVDKDFNNSGKPKQVKFILSVQNDLSHCANIIKFTVPITFQKEEG